MAAVAAAGCSLSVPSVNDDVESVTTTCASTYRVMAGCSAGWSVITDASRCAAVKAALVPAFSGVQEGGFGNEWANGTTAPLPVARLLPLCFICSTAGYHHLPLYPQPGFLACLMPSHRSGCLATTAMASTSTLSATKTPTAATRLRTLPTAGGGIPTRRSARPM